MAGKTSQLQTFEMVVSIDGPLFVPFDDWPANIQDAIFQALERVSNAAQAPMSIVHAECKTDHDTPKGAPGHYYLHVIASEVVMADERTLAPGTVVHQLPDDIKKLLH